jgi:hypothetical protein
VVQWFTKKVFIGIRSYTVEFRDKGFKPFAEIIGNFWGGRVG